MHTPKCYINLALVKESKKIKYTISNTLKIDIRHLTILKNKKMKKY